MINKKVMNPLECRWYFTERDKSIIIISPQREALPHFNKFYFVFENKDKRELSSLSENIVFNRYQDCYDYIIENNILDMITE